MKALFTSSNIAPLLLRRLRNDNLPYLTYQNVKSGLLIREELRRNRIFRVEFLDADKNKLGYFLKQPSELSKDRVDTLFLESLIYRFVRDTEQSAPKPEIKPHFPVFEFYDALHIIQATKLIKGKEFSVCLKQIMSSTDKTLSITLFSLLGLTIHKCHEGLKDAAIDTVFKSKKPFILEDHFFDNLNEKIESEKKIISVLSPFKNQIIQASKIWEFSYRIHGDLKFDNILVESLTTENLNLIITDWEMASKGDVRWDLAMVIGNLYLFGLLNNVEDQIVLECSNAFFSTYPIDAGQIVIIKQLAGVFLLQKIVFDIQKNLKTDNRIVVMAQKLLASV